MVELVSIDRLRRALPHTMQPGRGGGQAEGPIRTPTGALRRPDQTTRS